jgi:outer membrane lipoprotein carrier protein
MYRSGILSLFTAAALLAAAAPSPAQSELPAQEAETLVLKLQQLRSRAPSLTADFSEQKTSRLLAKPLETRGTLAFQTPNKFRREVKGANPSTVVSDGTQLWIYYPNFNEAELYTLGQRAFFDDAIAALTAGLNFDHVAEFYKFRAFREPGGYRFVLTPKAGGARKVVSEISVWLDQEFMIEKTVATLPKGDRVVTHYHNQRAAAVPGSRFEFKPPAGAKISQPLSK